jgi:6-phosphogluconate dehydrogenase
MMNIGIIGLGKIGNAVAQRLYFAGHTVFGFDLCKQARIQAQSLGIHIVEDCGTVAQNARVIWIFVPAGEPVDAIIHDLVKYLQAGDIVIDGGNSFYIDSKRRAQMLDTLGILYLDCGTSGGLHGAGNGFCLMVGGDKDAYTKIHDMLASVATPGGLAHIGPSGAGHYVKMIHNGIEYGLLQAYAEGLQLIKEGSYATQEIDLEKITRIWQHGSIIRSWILELTHEILLHDQDFLHIEGSIDETGTGRWAVEEAEKNNVPVPVIRQSLEVRAVSRVTGGNFATKLISLLRHAFGGHPIRKRR